MSLISFPLVSERLELRPFAPEDAEAMHPIYSNIEVMRWVGNGPVTDRTQTETIIGEYIDHQRTHGFSCWAVVETASGEVIGDAGLYTREAEVELGYTLARGSWDQGFATEAGRLCVTAAYDTLGLPALMAMTRPENTASAHVLEKLGFHPDGTVVDYGSEQLLFRSAAAT